MTAMLIPLMSTIVGRHTERQPIWRAAMKHSTRLMERAATMDM